MIEAAGLSAGYEPGRPVLEGLSFEARPGAPYVLLGKRGAGKRAFVKVLRGVLRPSAGAATVDGLDAGHYGRAIRRRLAFVSGSSGLYGDLSATRSASLFARLSGCAPSRTDVAHALRRAGLPERLFDAPARHLNAAHRLSASIATGILRGVAGFVMEEPTDGLDRRATVIVEAVVEDLRLSGHAVLVTTSDVSFAAAVADRVGILRDGRLETECTAAQLLEWSLPDFLSEFAGSSSPSPAQSSSTAG